MHDPSKFVSSGQVPEDGVVLYLYPISNLILQTVTVTDANLQQRSLTPKKVGPKPYDVTTVCALCEVRVRICVTASQEAIRGLQQLFLEGLSFYCATCSRNGRR